MKVFTFAVRVMVFTEMGALVTMIGKIAHVIQKWMRIVFPNQSIQQNIKHKFKAGDVVIFVNDFGVVWRWTISERTTYELCTGEIVPAYHHEDTQTPWFPTEETRLRKATKADLTASDAELQQRYGFTPTEWYGCY